MYAHSALACQCSSRTPPAVSRISTPAIVFETGSSRSVTCRVHPPLSILFRAIENGYLNGLTVPESVSTAHTALGFCPSNAEFVVSGRGSVSFGR